MQLDDLRLRHVARRLARRSASSARRRSRSSAPRTRSPARQRRASCVESKPVVPITTCTPAPTHARAFASAVSGCVKSTTHVGVARARASSVEVPSSGSARADELHVVRARRPPRTPSPPSAPRRRRRRPGSRLCRPAGSCRPERRRSARAASKRVRVGPDAGDRQPLGREQLVGERAQDRRSSTASIRADHLVDGQDRQRRASSDEPRRLMRAPVDSSDEHARGP